LIADFQDETRCKIAMMYCLRSYLPLLLLPLPLSLSPIHLTLFVALTYILNRPCIYCSFLLIVLFASSCYWSDHCFIGSGFGIGPGQDYAEETSALATWLIPRLYTTPLYGTGMSNQHANNTSSFLAEVTSSSTTSGVGAAMKDSLSGIIEKISSSLSIGLPQSLSSADPGIGTQWIRTLLGRSEWTLPCVGVKIIL